MSGLKGKFVRTQGEQIIFGSNNRPEWSPMYVAPNLYPMVPTLVPGKWYGMEVEDNCVRKLEALPDRPGYGGGQGAYRKKGGPITPDGLLQCATGVLKSALEGRAFEDPKDAMAYAVKWAQLWSQEHAPKEEGFQPLSVRTVGPYPGDIGEDPPFADPAEYAQAPDGTPWR